MLHNRTWIDRTAEAEFWKQMARLEGLKTRLSTKGRWGGLLQGGLFRRAAMQRDLDAIQSLAQDLVDRYTILAEAMPAAAPTPRGAEAAKTNDPLHTLAGMVVSLRQDRLVRPEVSEEKSV